MRSPEVTQRLTDRKVSYSQVFDAASPGAALVLKDLEGFCRGNHSCFDPDPRIHAALEGRREVWLRIQDFVKLTVDELYEKYAKGKTNVRDS